MQNNFYRKEKSFEHIKKIKNHYSKICLEQYIFISEQVLHIFVYKRNPYSFKVCLLLLEYNKLYKDTVFWFLSFAQTKNSTLKTVRPL